MKKITTVSLAACVALMGAGCHWVGIRGNGHIKTDERPVSAFANIDTRGAFTIEWQNGTPSLRITTDENPLSYIDSNVSNNTLHLHRREQIRPSHEVRVAIARPARERATTSGAVKLDAKQLSGARFALESRGASRVSLE